MASQALEKARNALSKIREHSQSIKAEQAEMVRDGLYTAAGAAAAYGLGYVQSAYPDKAQVGSVPISAIGALAILPALGRMLPSDEANDLVLELGKASLYTFAALKGAEKGAGGGTV